MRGIETGYSISEAALNLWEQAPSPQAFEWSLVSARSRALPSDRGKLTSGRRPVSDARALLALINEGMGVTATFISPTR